MQLALELTAFMVIAAHVMAWVIALYVEGVIQ